MLEQSPPRLCSCSTPDAVESLYSFWQQSRQSPPAVRMAWAGQMVQLYGPGPLQSRQEPSQSSQSWPEDHKWTGCHTNRVNLKSIFLDSSPLASFSKHQDARKTWIENQSRSPMPCFPLRFWQGEDIWNRRKMLHPGLREDRVSPSCYEEAMWGTSLIFFSGLPIKTTVVLKLRINWFTRWNILRLALFNQSLNQWRLCCPLQLKGKRVSWSLRREMWLDIDSNETCTQKWSVRNHSIIGGEMAIIPW